MLAALAPILGGVAGGLFEKEIGGSGIHTGKPWHTGRKKVAKKPKVYTLEKHGSGLYLNPWKGSGL